MNNQEPTKEQLQEQLHRSNKMIKVLENKIGTLTGENTAMSILYQEAQQELERIQSDQVAEMDKQADEVKKGEK